MIDISWYTKMERESMKHEPDNFMIIMKYYIVKRNKRYFISCDSFKKEKWYIYKCTYMR